MLESVYAGTNPAQRLRCLKLVSGSQSMCPSEFSGSPLAALDVALRGIPAEPYGLDLFEFPNSFQETTHRGRRRIHEEGKEARR